MKYMVDKIVGTISCQKIKSILKRVRYYTKIWIMMCKNSFMTYFYQKKILAIFLFGKLLRFIFFLAFLFFLVSGTDGLAGYSSQQVIFFYLTFNLLEIVSQFIFREVYRFQPLIISGDFDMILAKPVNPLFRVLFGGADVIDFITIPLILVAVVISGSGLHPEAHEIFWYIVLIANSLIIYLSIHIFIVSLGIITFQVDALVTIFRDINRFGTVPLDIIHEPLRSFITLVVPVGIMVSLPPKALLGILDLRWIVFSVFYSIVSIVLALNFWKYSLKKYTSVGS